MRRFSVLFPALVPLFLLCLIGCGAADSVPPPAGWERTELRYAERFTIDRDGAGRALVTINGTDRFLILPEGVGPPENPAVPPGNPKGAGLPENPKTVDPWEYPDGGAAVILSLPLESVYIASSSVLDFFSRLDALDTVRFTSTRPADWSLPAVREAMEAGDLLYAGKYSAPDFESLLAQSCGLAIENTMILHSPDIREQLEALGIPVLVEWSSYEPHPLGRMEWIKLYGLLTGREAEAAAFFDAQAELVEQGQTAGQDKNAEQDKNTEQDKTAGWGQSGEGACRTAAFFSISPGGYVNVRKPGDYAVRMLELAGGRYVFRDLLPEGDSAASSVNLQMEAFYAWARDADVLIYNGTIDGGLDTVEQLLDKGGLLADFRAVQGGDVWCTERNLFQEPTAAAGMIADLRAILDGTAADRLAYFHRLS